MQHSTTIPPISPPSIRPAQPSDAAALEALYAECMLAADWRATRETGTFAAASEGETVWVCVAGDRLLGFVSIWVPDRFVHHLYVHPDAQGQGVGRSLLASLSPWLAKPWRLKCNIANTRARAFYDSLGWHEVERGHSEQGAYALLEFRA